VVTKAPRDRPLRDPVAFARERSEPAFRVDPVRRVDPVLRVDVALRLDVALRVAAELRVDPAVREAEAVLVPDLVPARPRELVPDVRDEFEVRVEERRLPVRVRFVAAMHCAFAIERPAEEPIDVGARV